MSCISDAQRTALEVLSSVVDPTTYLGGGVAVALRLAHRQSRDLDLFVPIPVASFADLICMKLSAIAGRGARRDFWDLHSMLSARRQPLREAIEAYSRKYAAEDVGHVVRSLVYFADAEAEPLPIGLTPNNWEKIKANLRVWIRQL